MAGGKMAVGEFMERKLDEYKEELSKDRAGAQLALLRRGIGKVPGDMPEVWGALFVHEDSRRLLLSDEMLMKAGSKPTREEWAVYTAATLYALHQQGRRESVHQPGVGLGRAAARLVKNEEADRARVARRFNTFATASNMKEAAYHLRGLIQLLRAEDIGLDYKMLAQDLYEFQNPEKAPDVRLKWGRDFYRFEQKDEQKEDNENA